MPKLQIFGLLGIIERVTKKTRLLNQVKRDSVTLLDFILKNVKPRDRVITDDGLVIIGFICMDIAL